MQGWCHDRLESGLMSRDIGWIYLPIILWLSILWNRSHSPGTVLIVRTQTYDSGFGLGLCGVMGHSVCWIGSQTNKSLSCLILKVSQSFREGLAILACFSRLEANWWRSMMAFHRTKNASQQILHTRHTARPARHHGPKKPGITCGFLVSLPQELAIPEATTCSRARLEVLFQTKTKRKYLHWLN